jgi:hypothetical protein
MSITITLTDAQVTDIMNQQHAAVAPPVPVGDPNPTGAIKPLFATVEEGTIAMNVTGHKLSPVMTAGGVQESLASYCQRNCYLARPDIPRTNTYLPGAQFGLAMVWAGHVNSDPNKTDNWPYICDAINNLVAYGFAPSDSQRAIDEQMRNLNSTSVPKSPPAPSGDTPVPVEGGTP